MGKDKKGRGNIRWEKIDNTALLFSAIAGEQMTNVYRLSVILHEEIRQDLLQQALDIVLPKFDGFNLRLRTGLFWVYFEENGKPAPRVTEENLFPCRYIRPNKNNSYLFSVTYYGKKINLEVYHVLTDGMGGLIFLKELVYQYLRLSHPKLREQMGDSLSEQTFLSREDSFRKNYRRSRPKGYATSKAYRVHLEKLPAGEFGVMHGYMPLEQLRETAHHYGVSINEYLVGTFIWSVYQECLKGMPSKRPIRVAVPVNLRPYFDSLTTKNFFVMVSAEFFPKKESYEYAEVLTMVRQSLKSQINKEHLEDLFSYSVATMLNVGLRAIPIFIKNIGMRIIYGNSALANTSTVTNVGDVKVDEPYRQYIENFQAFIAMSKGQKLKGTICSYNGILTFTFTSIFSETMVQKRFFRTIAADGVDVRIETNGVYEN
ncbi:MAG: hypothetical protein LIO37_02830 [Clostridiales bacterium]|nr:hypothetical protein [Clostridiales bacterium]